MTPRPRTAPAQPQRWASATANTGLLLILAATAVPVFSHTLFGTMRWIYTAGTALLLAGRLGARLGAGASDAGAPLRLRRLRRLEVWTALVFAAGAAFMFLRNVGGTDWIAFTLAGGLLTAYTSVMIPREANPTK